MDEQNGINKELVEINEESISETPVSDNNDVARVHDEKGECCCHKEEKHDCCHEDKEPKKNSCCHHEHKELENEECRCHDKHEHEKKDKHEHKHEHEEHSCCCHHEHKEHAHTSCCGGSDDEEETCTCCGGGHTHKKNKAWYNNAWLKLPVSLAALIIGFITDHVAMHHDVTLLKYINPSWIAVIWCGVPIFINAIKALRKKRIIAAMLISIAIVASIFLEYYLLLTGSTVPSNLVGHSHSYVFAAGEVAFLMTLGDAIEAWTVRKSRAGVERLVSLVPKKAIVKTDIGLMPVELEKINVGDIVVVRAGETVSVDGVIVSGESNIDKSSMTGESIPVDCKDGDEVFCGTINLTAPIEIRVTKRYEDMTISHMVKMVKEAEKKRAPIARIADKWVTYIVPAALGLAVIVFLVALLILGQDANVSLVRGVTVLVVFCPCALALATPTAIAAAIGRASMDGALIKSGESLERLSKVDTICIDKTGTLTTGEAVVEKVLSIGLPEKEFLRYMGSCERYSDHPLARAIVGACDQDKLFMPKDVKIHQGIGVEGVCDGRKIFICSYNYAKQNNLNLFRLEEKAEDFVKEGMTAVVGYIDGQPRGVIGLGDSLRSNAKDVILSIEKLGYKIVLITGDNEYTARRTATECRINEYRFQQMPEDKVTCVEELRAQGRSVCMLGDGINDAPALATADVGIAMSNLGSDIAAQTADITVMNNDIATVEKAVKLSKRTMHTIIRNIIVAMSINFIAVILSAAGLLTPALGAIVHNCTSVLVVGSSALILIDKKKKGKAYTTEKIAKVQTDEPLEE